MVHRREFDEELVSSIRTVIKYACTQEEGGFVGISELHTKAKQVAQDFDLRSHDVEALAKTLVLEGTLQEQKVNGESAYALNNCDYIMNSSQAKYNWMGDIEESPCVGCPLLKECSVRPTTTSAKARKGGVSPSTCPYLHNWLGYDDTTFTF